MKAFYNKKDLKTVAKKVKDALAAGTINALVGAMFRIPWWEIYDHPNLLCIK